MSRSRKPLPGKPSILRCAIYTRVSTEHGLDQDFNSLDAQREACEAYVRSQTHEGWTLVRDRFDDGGFSGGSLERPALARLLAQVDAGRVDIIVVYKVDRLTRSLADFAKLVERFDATGASFVSITQSFNSTSSMGRLTLNMLLSFAQFEREVTGERIRDKIAASKRKGIWVGGNPPFGYVVLDRKLVIEEDEAKIVRMIFERYAALGSLNSLLSELRTNDVRTRLRVSASGSTRGGVFFARGSLAFLLKNRMYLGELNHHDASYPGEHPAILVQDLFDQVQRQLAEGSHAGSARRSTDDFPLKGLIYDDRGFRMMPSAVNKKGRRFRYYISRAIIEGAGAAGGSILRVSGPGIELAVLDVLRRADLVSKSEESDESRAIADGNLLTTICEKLVVSNAAIKIVLTADAADRHGQPTIVSSWQPAQTKVRREVLAVAGCANLPMRSAQRAAMLLAIATGVRWLDEMKTGTIASLDAIAAREGRSVRSISMSLSLAFLAPDIVQAAVDVSLPRGLVTSRLYDLPTDWTQQRAALGMRVLATL